MPLPWVKLHTDILADPKLLRAANSGARGLELLPWLIAFAQRADDGGRLTVAGHPAEPRDIAYCIPGVRSQRVASALEALTELGVLVKLADNSLQFEAWERRAGKPSDRSEFVRERVARHREKQAAATDSSHPLSDGNALHVTPRNAFGNALRNAPEVEVEEEVESPPSGEAPARARARTRAASATRRGALSHFVPDTWSPSESHRAKATELRVGLAAETEAFRLHEFKEPHSDWDRAFHKWLRRAPQFVSTNGNGHHGEGESSADRILRENADRAARDAAGEQHRARLNAWGLEVEKALKAAPDDVQQRIEREAEKGHEALAKASPQIHAKAVRAARLRIYGAEIGRPMPVEGA